MEKFEITGYFIEMKNPDNVVIEKKIVESNDTLRYVFNDASFDNQKKEGLYLINKSAINVSNVKERLIHIPGMGCPIKEELL